MPIHQNVLLKRNMRWGSLRFPLPLLAWFLLSRCTGTWSILLPGRGRGTDREETLFFCYGVCLDLFWRMWRCYSILEDCPEAPVAIAVRTGRNSWPKIGHWRSYWNTLLGILAAQGQCPCFIPEALCVGYERWHTVANILGGWLYGRMGRKGYVRVCMFVCMVGGGPERKKKYSATEELEGGGFATNPTTLSLEPKVWRPIMYSNVFYTRISMYSITNVCICHPWSQRVLFFILCSSFPMLWICRRRPLFFFFPFLYIYI